MFVNILDLACKYMRHCNLNRSRNVDNRFVFLIRFPHIQYGVADFHGIVDLCSREALRAVLKCKVSICLCCKIS